MKSLLFSLALLGLISPQAQAAPYTLSADGQEVTDQATGLIWRRCAEGMNWDGTTCAGAAATYTHENALIRAKTEATASGKAWRLPNVKELSTIVDRSRASPAIDVTAFPATPSAWFWTSSPYAGGSGGAWYVYFGDGGVVNDGRNVSFAVRLVRASQ